MNPARTPGLRRRSHGGLKFAVLNLVFVVTAGCGLAEGQVTMVGGPPRLAVLNSPINPKMIIPGTLSHVPEADCFILKSPDDVDYAVAWPTGAVPGYAMNEQAGVSLNSGDTYLDGDELIVNGELARPDSERAAKLPDISALCGGDSGGWILIAELEHGTP